MFERVDLNAWTQGFDYHVPISDCVLIGDDGRVVPDSELRELLLISYPDRHMAPMSWNEFIREPERCFLKKDVEWFELVCDSGTFAIGKFRQIAFSELDEPDRISE